MRWKKLLMDAVNPVQGLDARVCHASRLGGVGVKLMVGVGDPHSLHKVLVDFGELTIQ